MLAALGRVLARPIDVAAFSAPCPHAGTLHPPIATLITPPPKDGDVGFLPGTGPARAGRPARGAAQPRRPSSTRPATASAGLLLPAGPPAALLRPRGLPSAGLPSAHGRRGAGPAARSTLTLARAASAALEPRGPPTSRVGSRDGAAPGGVAPPPLSPVCAE